MVSLTVLESCCTNGSVVSDDYGEDEGKGVGESESKGIGEGEGKVGCKGRVRVKGFVRGEGKELGESEVEGVGEKALLLRMHQISSIGHLGVIQKAYKGINYLFDRCSVGYVVRLHVTCMKNKTMPDELPGREEIYAYTLLVRHRACFHEHIYIYILGVGEVALSIYKTVFSIWFLQCLFISKMLLLHCTEIAHVKNGVLQSFPNMCNCSFISMQLQNTLLISRVLIIYRKLISLPGNEIYLFLVVGGKCTPHGTPRPMCQLVHVPAVANTSPAHSGCH